MHQASAETLYNSPEPLSGKTAVLKTGKEVSGVSLLEIDVFHQAWSVTCPQE